MLITDLQIEQTTLQVIRDHHLDKLFERNNPSGILICHKHANGVRWQKRDIKNGHLVTSELSKKEKILAEKLAINLYRIICIQYVQKQLHMINFMIRNQPVGQQKDSNGPEGEQNVEEQPAAFQEEVLQLTPEPNGENRDSMTGKRTAGDYILPEKTIRMLLGKVRNCPRVPADFFQINSPYSQFIIPYLQEEYSEIIEWYNSDFQQNKEYPEYLQFEVKLGFKVRSKSEVYIADRLYEEGILFHYEEILLLEKDDSSPDFNMPITFIEKYIWEHFGAMDKEKYFHRTRGRVLDYMDHKWFPGINMITTYETKKHPLSKELVELYIRWLKTRYQRTFPDLPPDESFNMYDLAAYAKYSRIF